jgi:hypothetical protein
MSKVTIEIDSKWQKIVCSPFYYVVAAFQGVAITFAPLFLYWCGKGRMFPGYEWIIIPACFALIILVPLFYYLLGAAVISELKKK